MHLSASFFKIFPGGIVSDPLLWVCPPPLLNYLLPLLNKNANSVLCTFRSADPVVKTYLIKMYCLSLYGFHLWSLSSKSPNALQIALNKILRKVWNLPPCSHSSIVHCTTIIPAIHNTVFRRFNQFLSRSVLSHVPIVSSIIHQSSLLAYNFLGYNIFMAVFI